ncbi:C39 family peptidase [Chamaesiphon sp.]|uniref:C39 family peptidase n=1 Tax=Chamaesiphon sp. TaxID=2814140 RepID=UPI0035936586
MFDLQYQIDKLHNYSSSFANLDTTTTYFSQRDNYTMPHRTCNSSANAMYLDWLMAATTGKRLGGDDGYLRKVLSVGDTIYHENQTVALKSYGWNTVWNVVANIREDRDILRSLVCSGIPVVVNILHRGRLEAPRGGHIILLCGWLSDSMEWLAQDPYGSLRSDYQDSNGRLSRISGRQFNIRWQGGFRTLA